MEKKKINEKVRFNLPQNFNNHVLSICLLSNEVHVLKVKVGDVPHCPVVLSLSSQCREGPGYDPGSEN